MSSYYLKAVRKVNPVKEEYTEEEISPIGTVFVSEKRANDWERDIGSKTKLRYTTVDINDLTLKKYGQRVKSGVCNYPYQEWRYTLQDGREVIVTDKEKESYRKEIIEDGYVYNVMNNYSLDYGIPYEWTNRSLNKQDILTILKEIVNESEQNDAFWTDNTVKGLLRAYFSECEYFVLLYDQRG